MKNTVLNQKQRDLVNEYYEFSKSVVASSFHFADVKDISTGYSLEDAIRKARLLFVQRHCTSMRIKAFHLRPMPQLLSAII